MNTSMYDAQQGATSGAQVDVNTMVGTSIFRLRQASGMMV